MPTHAPARTFGTTLRALASLIVLMAAVVGLPLLLAAVTPVVWATSHDDLTHLLDRQDTGGAFLLLLIAIAWIGWAQFTLCVLREIPAQLRGRTWQAPRGLGSSQRLASVLVGGILVLLPTGTAMASPATAAPAAAAPATHAPQHAHPAPAGTVEARTVATHTEDSAPTHTVRPAESLWSIAEDQLGDGERWRDIARLNEGRTMADGSAFNASTFLQPGWKLRMPAPLADQRPAPAKGGEGAHETRVSAGDTLWDIAEKEMGDGTQYRQIFEANRGARQPDGTTLTDPADIQAGLELHIPLQPPAAPDKPADPQKPRETDRADKDDTRRKPTDTSPPKDHSKEDAPKPPKDEHQDQADGQPAPPTAKPEPPAKTAPPAQPDTPAPSKPQHTPAADTEEPPVGVREAAGIGVLLAGCLIATIGVKRLLQRRRRRPGETIAMPAEPRLEHVLEASSEPGSVELLNRALRTLADNATAQGAALPDLRGARVTARTIELLPQDTQAAPLPPFTVDGEGRWLLDENQPLLPPADAREVPAPYPALVTLGTDPDGSHLLLNLGTARVLLLDGDPDAVRDTARVIALEAATSQWSDHAEVLTIGLGDELPTLLPQGRLRVVPHLGAAQSELGELLLDHHQSASDEELLPLPWLLICSAYATAADARHLADALTAARDLPVALVLPAREVRAAFPDAVHLHVGSNAPQHLDALDSDVLVQSLTEEDFRAFLDVLHTAEKPSTPAQGTWQRTAPAPLDDEPDTAPDPAPEEAPFTGLTAVPFTALTTASDAASPSSVPQSTLSALTEQSAPATSTETPATPDEAVNAAAPLTQADVGEPDAPTDLHAPEIQILGPVTVTGIQASGHGFKLALLAALLHFKPDGCTIDTAREAMDPRNPWSKQTLQVRISELRNRLGADADGNLYLPKTRTGVYRLSPKIRSDWDRFQHLAKRGLTKGPATGAADLQAALALVKGRPFGGADLTWAAARTQEILVRITDVAHTLATWHRTAARPDLDAARRAVRIGLDIDSSAELLYQDWMLIEAQAHNPTGVRTAYETLRDVNRGIDVGMEPATEQLYDTLMSRSA